MLKAMICCIDTCDREVFGRGLCGLHYKRHRKAGTLDSVAMLVPSAKDWWIPETERYRVCGKCGQNKPLEEFGKNSQSRLGRRRYCKPCLADAANERRAKNAESARAYSRARYRNGVVGPWEAARSRARIHGLPFSISKIDIPPVPSCCPVPGCDSHLAVAEGNAAKNSPSLDRIVPGLGYVPGNIMWLCYDCNRRKSNVTAEQHEYFARVMREAEARLREPVAA